jgi:hypothetical protein
MTTHSKMILVAAFCLGLTAAALAQSDAVRAIYRASASIPTNVEGVYAYPAPPTGFNPLSASDEELAAYGFPPRPDKVEDAHGYQVWARVMSMPTTRWFGELKVRSNRSHPATARLSQSQTDPTKFAASSGVTKNWSGVVNTLSSTSYSSTKSFCCVAAEFVVPQPQQAFNGSGGNICDGDTDQAAFWVGQGGFTIAGLNLGNQNNIAQSGVDIVAPCGDSNGSAYAWMEWYPANLVEFFPVSAGDDIYVSVNNTSSTTATINLVDETGQHSVSVSLTAPSGVRLVGNEAEFVVERPYGDSKTPTGYYPLANYIWSFWDYARSKTFAKKYYYPGTTAASTYDISMTDDVGDQIISVPTVGTSGTLGLEGMFVQDQDCAQLIGCVP